MRNQLLKRFVVLFICGLLLLGSVNLVKAQQTGDGDTAYTAADVAHSVSLEKIRASLLASMTFWKAGDYKSAVALATNVNSEFNAISVDLATQKLDTPLKELLDAYSKLAGQSGDIGKIEAAYQAVLDKLDYTELSL